MSDEFVVVLPRSSCWLLSPCVEDLLLLVVVVEEPFLSIKELPALLPPLEQVVPGSCESLESSCESRRWVNCFAIALSMIFVARFFSALSSSEPSVELPEVVLDLWNLVLRWCVAVVAWDLRIARGVFELLLLSDEPASHSSKISFKQLLRFVLVGDGIVLYGLAATWLDDDDEDEILVAGIDIVDDSVRNLTSTWPRFGMNFALSTELERASFRLPAPACPKNFSLLSFLIILMPEMPSMMPTFALTFGSGSLTALRTCCSFFSLSATSEDKRSWIVMLMRPSDFEPRRFNGDDGSASSSSFSSSWTIEHFRFLPFYKIKI